MAGNKIPREKLERYQELRYLRARQVSTMLQDQEFRLLSMVIVDAVCDREGVKPFRGYEGTKHG